MAHDKEMTAMPQQVDITAPQVVQIEYDARRKVLYVHVDGYSALRICRITKIDMIGEVPRANT